MADLHAQTDKPLFISYSRANRAFALDLRQKLADLGFKQPWRDIEDMPIGENWWQSIQKAIQECDTLILCMSPESLASPNVADEWHYAREQGKRMMPVVAANVDFATVPRWMGRVDWADFRPSAKDADLVWARFINQLNSPYEPRKVPFMVEPLPPDFVQRPAEFEPLVQALVDATHGAVAISAALKGAGGFGKTTLARAIANDRRVRAAFDDGVLWITLGERVGEQDLIGKLLDLCFILTGQRPPVNSVETAHNELCKAVSDAYLLLIVDDVWQNAHLQPFLNLGKNAATLITTRNSGILPTESFKQPVDAMKANEALALLRYRLPAGEDATMQALTKRLGEWPLLLKLANGALRKRIERGESLKAALEWIDKALTRKSFEALADPDNKDQRHRAASAALGVSLELLDTDQRAKYERLAIFPEDADVPLVTLEKLWISDDFDVEELCERYADLSLLLAYDLRKRTIRLHDVVRTYLRDTRKADLPTWNAAFLGAYGLSDWSALPAGEPYLWRGLAYHLSEAGRDTDLRSLLLSANWLWRKLDATDIGALLADYDFTPQGDDPFRLVRSALSLSAHVLNREGEKSHLAYQLQGRLFVYQDMLDIQQLVDNFPITTFRPLNATHLQAGGTLLRTLEGHTYEVSGALELADGRFLSWAGGQVSTDKTLRLWSRQGEPLVVLNGHTHWVRGALELADGRFLSWAGGFRGTDRTLRLWSRQGEPLAVLEGHTNEVRGALALADGRILSWSSDHTLRLWSEQGQPLTVLSGHTSAVWGVLALADGRFLSWSSDYTLRLWSEQGQPLTVLSGHTDAVWGGLALPDGRFLSWANDKTLRLWSGQGKPLAVLSGHTGLPSGALALSDGHFLSWSRDHTLRLWSGQGEPLTVLSGHTDEVRGALALSDGRFLSWSLDHTLRLWSEQGEPLTVLSGHTSAVWGVLALADGRFLSWGHDAMLRLWNGRGESLAVLEGHTNSVRGVLALADGRFLSWSVDHTLRLWSGQSALPAYPERHTGAVGGVLALTDGHFLSWADEYHNTDHTLRLWNGRGEPLAVLEGHTRQVQGVLALADGRFLSWADEYWPRLWSAQGKLLAVLSGHTMAGQGVLALTDGHLLSWSWDRTLRLWSGQGDPLAVLEGHTDAVWGALALSDGRFLSWSPDKTLRLWSGQGDPLAVLEGHTDAVVGALALSNGRFLSGAGKHESKDHSLRLWDGDGAPLRILEGHTSQVTGALALSDGRFLSWAGTYYSEDHSLRLWDGDGAPLHILEGHTKPVTGALALSDGRFLSWSLDKTLRLWDGDGAPLHILEGHTEHVIGALVLSDGRFLSWTGGYNNQDYTLRLWDYLGNPLAAFYGDAPITCCALSQDGQIVVAGDKVGRVMFLRLPQ